MVREICIKASPHDLAGVGKGRITLRAGTLYAAGQRRPGRPAVTPLAFPPLDSDAAITASEIDTFGIDHGWGLGYMLNQRGVAGPNRRTFGHGGSGGAGKGREPRKTRKARKGVLRAGPRSFMCWPHLPV